MRQCGLIVLVICLVGGCSGKYPYVPVSGKVTLNGKPLADALVQFQPTGGTLNKPVGRGSLGKTDSEGQFTLRVKPGQNGALVGSHRVAINKKAGFLDLVPKQYNSESKLTFDVPPDGTDAANFELTSAKK